MECSCGYAKDGYFQVYGVRSRIVAVESRHSIRLVYATQYAMVCDGRLMNPFHTFGPLVPPP